jgi:hypothetical protein
VRKLHKSTFTNFTLQQVLFSWQNQEGRGDMDREEMKNAYKIIFAKTEVKVPLG